MARRARGTESNPQSRFEKLRYDASLASEPAPLELGEEPEPDPRTVLLRDPTRSIVARSESPDVLDTLGMPIAALRYAYVVTGAALAGLGGAYLSLAYTPSWIENMTAGRGWIAIALVIFAAWRPWWVLGGAILFGAVDALRFRAQVGGDPIVDPHFLNMLPYLATLVVLALVSRSVVRRRLGVPAALGVAYDREQR